jgi:hypothetical protein
MTEAPRKRDVFKGIVSNILLKNGWKKIAEKSNHKHPRSNNFDVCTHAALCILDILDIMVLKNIYYLQMLHMKW